MRIVIHSHAQLVCLRCFDSIRIWPNSHTLFVLLLFPCELCLIPWRAVCTMSVRVIILCSLFLGSTEEVLDGMRPASLQDVIACVEIRDVAILEDSICNSERRSTRRWARERGYRLGFGGYSDVMRSVPRRKSVCVCSSYQLHEDPGRKHIVSFPKNVGL